MLPANNFVMHNEAVANRKENELWLLTVLHLILHDLWHVFGRSDVCLKGNWLMLPGFHAPIFII